MSNGPNFADGKQVRVKFLAVDSAVYVETKITYTYKPPLGGPAKRTMTSQASTVLVFSNVPDADILAMKLNATLTQHEKSLRLKPSKPVRKGKK